MAKKALEGIRVIDLTVWFQGPVSSQYLADFGAEVIKVEPMPGGDKTRDLSGGGAGFAVFVGSLRTGSVGG